jgi:hypothetical protein
MGRSVSYQSGAAVILYFSPDITGKNEDGEFNQDLFSEEHDDLRCNIISSIKAKYKSFYLIDRQEARNFSSDRECWPILSNDLVTIYLSEYCGLYSLSIVPNNRAKRDGYRFDTTEALAKKFASQISKGLDKIIDECGGRPASLIGRASNGEAFYMQKKTS